MSPEACSLRSRPEPARESNTKTRKPGRLAINNFRACQASGGKKVKCRGRFLVTLVILSVSPVVAGDFEIDRETTQRNPVNGGYNRTGGFVSKKGRIDVNQTAEQIRTDIELKLRLAGIKVDPKSYQYLHVTFVILQKENGPYAFGLYVSFNQLVSLVRNPGIFAVGKTWSVGGIATGSGSPGDHCRGMVRDYVDQFVNAYLSVNPK
jgi:hypothetical protein